MIKLIVDKKEAVLFKGRPLSDVPKTYKRVKTCYHSIGSDYNSSLLVLFKARDGTFRYEIYRDGCIYPYYGKLIFT